MVSEVSDADGGLDVCEDTEAAMDDAAAAVEMMKQATGDEEGRDDAASLDLKHSH